MSQKKKRHDWKTESMLWRGAWLALQVNLAEMKRQNPITIGLIEKHVQGLGDDVLRYGEMQQRTEPRPSPGPEAGEQT